MSQVNRSRAAAQPAPPPRHPRRRYTKQQIQERRLGIWEMHCCGQPTSEMAASYGVSEKTILRDLKWWEERLGYNTEQLKDPKNAAMDVGMTAAKLEKLAQDAYVEYAASNNPTFKVRYMEASGKFLYHRHKILSDAGFLPKIGHEQEEAFVQKITFEARFGKEAPQAVFDNHQSRRNVLEAVSDMLRLGIGADGVPLPEIMEAIEAGDLEDPA